MKFFISFQSLVFLVPVVTFTGCIHHHEKDQIQELIESNRTIGPNTDDTLLSIKFGDSRTGYQKKMDSLHRKGVIESLVPDSLLERGGQDLSYYKYYYVFNEYEALERVKWIFSPVFEDNRLVELNLVTSSVLDESIAERSFDINKGILRNIIDASEEVMANADVTYRIAKAHFSDLYGTPEFVSESRDQCYWFKGNCVISITNTMSAIKIQFKNSKLK